MSDDSTETSPSVESDSADTTDSSLAETVVSPSVAGTPSRVKRIALLALVIIVLDQLTKSWAVSSLANEPPVSVFWTLQWNLSFNSGMAFSQAQGIGPIIGVLATLVVIGLALSLRKIDHPVALIAGGLIIGGAIGNLVDRLFRGRGWMHGAVVDFIDFQWFPIFNIADSAITVGGVLFALWSLFAPQTRSR
jgi:signal peptidase II